MFYNINLDETSVKMFKHMGVSPELFLKEAGIPHRALQNDKFELTTDDYKRLVKAMDKLIAPEFIISFSTVDTVSAFVPEFFAGLCAENGLSCIRRISKYKKIVAPVVMEVVEEDNHVSISYIYSDGDPLNEVMIVHAQLNILSIIRKGTGDNTIQPLNVQSLAKYHENAIDYFGVEPKSAIENKIVFNKEDLDRPFITTNNRMWDYLESELNQRLREIEVDRSFSALVRKTLLELLPSGISDADHIAKELAVSKRTLQRKLNEEGTSFNEQLNHTRELMVKNYLQLDMNLDEIAFLVSYSDAKSLSRAFKTWTGLNVSDYKRQNFS